MNAEDLDSALVARQGLQDVIANITSWLDSTDKQLEQIMKPASLIRDRLDEQMRLLSVLKADVISHEPSINKMYESAQQFIQNSSNVRETKKIESKVNEVRKKFETLVKTVQTREGFFIEISQGLQHLSLNAKQKDPAQFLLISSLGPASFCQSDVFGLYRLTEEMREGQCVYIQEHDTL